MTQILPPIMNAAEAGLDFTGATNSDAAMVTVISTCVTNGGLILICPGGICRFQDVVDCRNVNGLFIVGSGIGATTFQRTAGSMDPGPVFWWGSNSSATAQVTSGGMSACTIDGNGIADYGLRTTSIYSMDFLDLSIVNAIEWGWWIDCLASATYGSANSQRNRICNINFDQSGGGGTLSYTGSMLFDIQAAGCFKLDGAASEGYDPSLNYIDGLRFDIRNGDGLYLGNCDTNGIQNGFFFNPSPSTFTATFTSGSSTLAVTSTPFPSVGKNQYLTDQTTPGNLPTGVYITAFDAGLSQITMSANATGTASSGDTINAANLGTGIVFQDLNPSGNGLSRHNNLKNMETASSGVIAQDTNTYVSFSCTTATTGDVTTVTCPSTSGLAAGNYCYAQNIPPQTQIASIVNGTQFTLATVTSYYDVSSPSSVTFSIGAWLPSGPNYLELNLGNSTAVDLPVVQGFALLPRYAEGVHFDSGMVAGCFVTPTSGGDTDSLGTLQNFINRTSTVQPAGVNIATTSNSPAILIEDVSTGNTATFTLDNAGSLAIVNNDGDTVSITGASGAVGQEGTNESTTGTTAQVLQSVTIPANFFTSGTIEIVASGTFANTHSKSVTLNFGGQSVTATTTAHSAWIFKMWVVRTGASAQSYGAEYVDAAGVQCPLGYSGTCTIIETSTINVQLKATTSTATGDASCQTLEVDYKGAV